MEEQGRILSLSGGLYTVKTDSDTLLCFARGAFRRERIHPVVGDLVVIDREANVSAEEKKRGARGLITKILPRKNVLIRPPIANLDTLFLVASVKDPEPSTVNIDKLLSICVHHGIKPVLVFTKKELDTKASEALTKLYRNAGFDAVCVTKEEVEICRELLYPLLEGQICALAGASGVGKSTLANFLFPFLSAETGCLSEKTMRGRHTTRQTTLYEVTSVLNKEEPVYIADTPGFSLLDFERFFFMEKSDLVFSYPEFTAHLGHCKYTKCSHRTEDGCKILEAVRCGLIAESRHSSYRELYAELEKTKDWELDKKKTHR